MSVASDVLLSKGYCRGDDILVHLDPEHDCEEEADDQTGKTNRTAKGVHVATNVAKHTLMKAACYGHPPGFVFGVGKAVFKKVQAHEHEKHVSEVDGATVRVIPLRVANLAHLRAHGEHDFARESPYVTVQLVMEGITPSDSVFRAQTKPMIGGGTDCHFPKGTEAHIALPMDDLGAAHHACLFVEVFDSPDVALLARGRGREVKFGSALVEIGSLVRGLEEFGDDEAAACHVNLALYKDAEMTTPGAPPTGGMVRLLVHVERHPAGPEA